MNVKKIPLRDEIDQSEKWDLAPLFRSDEEWETLYNEVESQSGKYENFRGKMGESPELFRGTIEFDLEISRKLDRLYTYAHLKNDEDKTNQEYTGVYQKAINLYMRVSELSSFITPEIQSMPEEKLNSYLDSEGMKEYSFYLEKIIRYRPHTLSLEIEKVLSMSGEMAQASSEIFSQLDNADMKFGEIEDEEGKKVELSHGNFNTFLMKKSRELREKAFRQYYKSYYDHRHTISSSLAHSNKKDHFYARVRNFKSCREASLFSDNISGDVYDNLLSTIKENLGPLFKYLRFRKEVLGLDKLHFYDTYVPLIDNIDFSMEYNEAVDICIKSLAPLGNDYTETLKKGLLGSWVDRYENRGKRSGAYSSGCYDSPPYILMNYEKSNINSLYTLTHEAGHSMHSFYSKNEQPYVNYQYTIFVAEVASTFNETLLSHYLLDYYSDNPGMKAYILNREIDNIRATLYRQTMFAEYEKLTHTAVEKNIPLTLEFMQTQYRTLLETYFGDTMVIDDELTLECLRIPHFYSAFYVYKYATGISAAIALAQKVLSHGKSARNSYINFLKLGGSSFPLDQLKEAGVDMQSPEPVKNAVEYFDSLVDRFIEIYSTL
jgi:oligoendopeptidase F